MTKLERERLREAIKEVMAGGDYVRGLDILYKLAGYGEFPTMFIRRTGTLINIDDVKPTRSDG